MSQSTNLQRRPDSFEAKQTTSSSTSSSSIAQQAAAAAAKRRKQAEEQGDGQKNQVNNAHLQKVYQRLSLSIYGIPLVGTIVAIALLPYTGLHWFEIVLVLVLHTLGFLGLEVGYHRLFSHRAFKASEPVQAMLAIWGAITVQGGVVHWVAQHRIHHRYSDHDGDPHSPHVLTSNVEIVANGGNSANPGLPSLIRGLWHAQIGWVLEGNVPNVAFWAKDMLRSPVIARINQLQQVWVVTGILLPAVLDGLITQSWMGALRGLLWGGFVRVFISQHTLGSTNSLGHLFGNRLFRTKEHSTNNIWMAIPSMGQAWHNNHHAFPNSAVAGFYWWQIDPGTWFLRALEKMGWVWDLKVPTKAALDAKRMPSD